MPNCVVCGTEVLGTVNDSVIVIRLNTTTDEVEHLHYCVDRTEVAEGSDDEKEVKGCQSKLGLKG
jgi:hypothetical protein